MCIGVDCNCTVVKENAVAGGNDTNGGSALVLDRTNIKRTAGNDDIRLAIVVIKCVGRVGNSIKTVVVGYRLDDGNISIFFQDDPTVGIVSGTEAADAVTVAAGSGDFDVQISVIDDDIVQVGSDAAVFCTGISDTVSEGAGRERQGNSTALQADISSY